MTDENKTKEQLILELDEMRQQVAGMRDRLKKLQAEPSDQWMQSEEALGESELLLRLVFENAFDGICIYEEFPGRREHRLLDCNERYAEMAGRPKEELLAIGNTSPLQKRVTPARSDQESLILRKERRSYQGVFSWIRPDGQENIIEYSASPIQAGERSLSVGVDRDITERVHAEEALRQASRLEATATLAAGIAHDFNNLMTSVLGNAEMLKLDLASQRDALDTLDVISTSAQRAARLAQQMLAFARGGRYQPQTVHLNEIVRQVVSTQERTVPAQIRFLLDADPDLWPIKADPAQMSEVVLNVLTNAVEAVESNGRISLSTGNRVLNEGDIAALKPGRYVCLAVQDTGHGMSQEVQRRVFEPFFTTKFQGRGMGLSAVYGIIDNHDGHIAVQSEEGQGATLEIYLPAIEEPAPSEGQESSEKHSDAPATSTATVLIVQDSEPVQKLTQRMVERMGYHVLVARSRQQAIEAAQDYEGTIDLALIDVEGSGLKAPDMYACLSNAQPGIRFVLSGSDELDVRVQALLVAGIGAFVQKPFQVGALEAEVRRALGEEQTKTPLIR